MRTSHGHRNSSTAPLPWKWIGIIGGILGLILISRFFSGGSASGTGEFLTVSLNTESTAYINTTESKKREVKTTDKLYVSDFSLSVSTGSVKLSGDANSWTLDKGADVSYLGSGSLRVNRGRAWIDAGTSGELKMKNFDASLAPGDVVIAEQQTMVYSMLYALKGDIEIRSGDRAYTLPAGKRIMISQSDLSNPSTTLESLTDDIGNSLDQVGLFIANDGANILKSGLEEKSGTGEVSSGTTLSGSTIGSGSLQTGKYIEITSPIDGSVLTTPTVIVSGRILSKDVRKVKVGDKEAVVSPVDETFILKDFPLVSTSTDIVIKAYDAGGNILERAVVTIQTKAKSGANDKLVPTNFGLGDKNYHITSPTENPYRTNDDAITVSGVVPAGMVSYITVNGYKLQKFTPKAATWYYYANTKYGTMKDGFNLYEIKFFGSDGWLLSSQAFTIIKEGPLVSGEKR